MRERDDLSNDHRCGFSIITARDLDLIGAQGVIDSLKKRVGNNKVYISVDIDSLDPAFAPGISQFSLLIDVQFGTNNFLQQPVPQSLAGGRLVRC
jgi:hypothetical protein